MVGNPKRGSVLVTGTSTGIGKAAALALDKLGFTVFAGVRSEKDGQALCSEASRNLAPVLMDVTDSTSIEKAKQQVSQLVGEAGLAGLVNNAGVGFLSPLECVPLDDLRWVFDVNVFGLLAVTQAFLPLLRQGRGRLINVSSEGSIFVMPFHGSYSASKFAVNGLTDALRLELKPQGIQVSLIIFGSVKTPIWDKTAQLSDRISRGCPPQLFELYKEHFRKVSDYFYRLGANGISPEASARSVVHALTARRPKLRYYVGPDANLYNILDKIFYGRLRDWTLCQIIGLRGKQS